MYCFQDGNEVISIKREATDTQLQEKSAVAVTFPEIKAEEEVSRISLYPLLSGFSNTLCCQNTSVLCYTHGCTQYIHLNMFQTSARAGMRFCTVKNNFLCIFCHSICFRYLLHYSYTVFF
jgi:hypothetical protein